MEKDTLLIIFGAALYIVLMHQIPILRQLGNNQILLDNIEGIDLNSLRISRERGLI